MKNEGEILDGIWRDDGACRCTLLGQVVLEIVESTGRSDGCFFTLLVSPFSGEREG